MSEEQLKAFIGKVQGDDNLQEKLKAAADVDAVLAIAKDAGFSISADDLKRAQSELSEEELEGAAGGNCQRCNHRSACSVTYVPCVVLTDI
ncbi:nif11-like leader peptide domain protein [Synechococcus sp. BIOS-E4-1]|uniref:Nif11-like leader peptide family natural product precursor n=1 Tax=Synechococcus sp. BIOS-E4-1 TaxID=1400864 RepID=UPI001645E20C|nr:Nif11-like leader peptide family natural product precursor [Synechococcus sp. BIOS-E4-1]QNI54994.1 nif11-like leader peptide domain protein [Synechococcus sp. BIOS-E4-1]